MRKPVKFTVNIDKFGTARIHGTPNSRSPDAKRRRRTLVCGDDMTTEQFFRRVGFEMMDIARDLGRWE